MEIKHTITDSAEQALLRQCENYANRLRETAVSEALSSRGVPVEVTASDVMRAAQSLSREPLGSVSRRTSSLLRLVTLYFWAGMALVGASLMISALSYWIGLDLPISKRSVGMIGLSGLFFAAAAGAMRLYVQRLVKRYAAREAKYHME